MRRLLALVFKHNNADEDVAKLHLLSDMQFALDGYRRAQEQYDGVIRDTEDAGSALAQFYMAKIVVFREQYTKARLQYEQQYGDVSEYISRVKRESNWREERKFTCIHQNLHVLHSAMPCSEPANSTASAV